MLFGDRIEPDPHLDVVEGRWYVCGSYEECVEKRPGVIFAALVVLILWL